MMILKELRCWSESELVENCQFHGLVRSALGLFNTDDPLPCEATYYNFHKSIVEYENQGNGNLMEYVFEMIIKFQASD